MTERANETHKHYYRKEREREHAHTIVLQCIRLRIEESEGGSRLTAGSMRKSEREKGRLRRTCIL